MDILESTTSRNGTVNAAATTVSTAIDRLAEVAEHADFLISPETGHHITFGDLRQQVRAVSRRLATYGLQRGDKVAFLLDNGLFTAQLFLGTIYGGYVAVPLNVRAGVSQLSHMLLHSDAKVLFVEDKYHILAEEALHDFKRDVTVIPASVDDLATEIEISADQRTPEPVSADDVALLMYTSGSVGRPKAAVHTHRTILAHGWNSIQAHQLASSDRSLLVLPLYHINAECVTLIPSLLSGGSVVMPRRFSVADFWDWLDVHRCTWSAVVPTIISQLLDWNDPRADSRGALFQRIRFLRSSSAPLSPALHYEFMRKFDLLLIQAMGSSEAGNIFSNPQPPGKNKIGSPGLVWGFETRLIDRDGNQVAAGEPGEILIRGAAMMKGYYKDPEGSASVLDADGWFHSGDLAYQDEDGYFFVVGRSKELIIKGGVNIAPKQIDEVIESHPAVLEAAAVGVPDSYLGEEVVAFAVLRSGMRLQERDLLTYCQSRLGDFKTPARIHFVSELPKGPSGKVQRLRLVEKLPAMIPAIISPDGPPVSSDALKLRQIQETIAVIWSDVLGQEIDPDANFFALGGHSLPAIQCLSRFRDQFGLTLSLADFFQNATVNQQATLIRQRLYAAWAPGKPKTVGSNLPAFEHAAVEQLGLQTAIDRIPLRDPSIPCPLSAGQRRIWFFDQLAPGVPVYNESETVRLLGPLDLNALEQGLNVIIERHQILRSTIRVLNGEPVAIVHGSWPLKIKQIDLSELSCDRRQQELDRLLIDEPARPYRLDVEPGIRATVLRLGPQEHVLILMMHHMVCDFASEGVIWRELSVLYRGLLHGETPTLPVLPIQYPDFAAWQRDQVESGRFTEDLAYWKQNLKDIPEFLDLPSDRARMPVQTYKGRTHRFRLSAALTAALRGFSKREHVSLFTVFAAALNILLFRYTGSDCVPLGIPLADRDRDDLQPLIGFLLQTHVLLTRLSAAKTFRDVLAEVQTTTLDLYAHRAVPFDAVVASLKRERNLSYSPLFQVMMNWRNDDQLLSKIGLDGLNVEHLLSQAGTSKFDLTFTLTDYDERIWVDIEYSSDLFDLERIVRMERHYETLLQSAVSDPMQPVAQLPILPAEELRFVMHECNDHEHPYPSDVLVNELFEQQAARTPSATALQFRSETLTYAELDKRSAIFASRLRASGVQPGGVVAVYLERSVDLVVALLGILKAGAGYLPLDILFPTERVSFMLHDAQPQAVATSSDLAARLPETFNIVCLDKATARPDGTPVAPIPGGNRLAYLLYTSGSTGKPKGVQVNHRSVVNFLSSMRRTPGIVAGDTLLSVTTPSFDIFGLELWLPLSCGAKVVLAAAESTHDGRNLMSLMERCGARVMQATPSTWKLLIEAGWQGSPHLKILCGGEPWSSHLAEQLIPRCKSLWNMYGPTETTIWSSVYQVRDASKVLMGRPIANTQFYVVDAQLQPVPIGIPGELLIGGDGLADGYHNRPELTASSFIPNPFGAPGSHVYRTGDLVRYLPDGNVEFIGRLDHQVKLRGFRVELGEVESVLRQHPGVAEAVVVVREDTGEKQLTAFVRPSTQPSVPAGELRTLLRQKLPDYMVPGRFEFLESLPLTANGKVDRKALVYRPLSVSVSAPRSATPRDELERQLTTIWERILGVHSIGVHDSFFDLGGHSLAAVRALSGIKDLTGRQLPLATLFHASTVAEIADLLRKDGWCPSWSSLVPIQTGGSRTPLFLVHGAEGNVLLYRQLAIFLGTDRPVYGLQSKGLRGDGRFHESIQEMAEHYVKEIVAAHPVGPYILGGYCLGGTIALAMAALLSAQGRDVQRVVLIDTYNLSVVNRRAKSWLAPLHFMQNCWFHAANVLSVPSKDGRAFVKEKFAVERGRLMVRLESLLDTLRYTVGRRTQRRHVHLAVKQINDLAALKHQPTPFGGPVALIRAKGNFWGLSDPDLGWRSVLGSNLRVEQVPVYRKGLLVEPFVAKMAQTLKACIENCGAETVTEADSVTSSAM